MECLVCGTSLGPQEEGDVTCCTVCGQWHVYYVGLIAIEKSYAAALADQPMDPYECLEALDSAAAAMVIEYPLFARDPHVNVLATLRKAG